MIQPDLQNVTKLMARGLRADIKGSIHKLKEFASWMIWYPDLFLDYIKPETGGITLDADQRILLRSICRFYELYGCFPRGYSKTLAEQLGQWIICIRYPNTRTSLTAQTKENAASLVKDKTNEILRFYPILKNELARDPRLQRNDAEILFKNGSRIDVLANQQSSKGQRRERLFAEESALMNATTFEDAIKPIVEVPRFTCGPRAVVDPFEVHQQIHFFTTPSWRGSDEHKRTLDMIRDMIDLKGAMCLGSDWMLPCWYGRGSTKSQILQKMKTMSPITFGQNYGGRWTGASTGALVSVNDLIACRCLEVPLFKSEKASDEIFLGIDVARSQNSANNQSSIVVVRAIRSERTGRIAFVELVNIIHIPNTYSFTSQAVVVKRTRHIYNAKMAVVDGNGLGAGLIDELLKDTIDHTTGESLGCWDTSNTSNEPEVQGSEQCVFDLKAQSFQSRIITTFMEYVSSKKLRLLKSKQFNALEYDNVESYSENMMPFVQTDLLFEEINNLKMRPTANGGITIEKVVEKTDKDRFSALAYVLFYINEYENSSKSACSSELTEMFAMRPPVTRRL